MKLTANALPGILFALIVLLHPLSARADILVSTVDVSQAGPAGVLRFDQDSGTSFTIGDVPPFSTQDGPLGPTDVAVGPDGNIYVVDRGFVLYFDGTTGVPLPSPFGESHPDGVYAAVSSSDGLQFTSLAFDPSGQLYVADAALQAVRVYNGPGTAEPGVQVDTLLDRAAGH